MIKIALAICSYSLAILILELFTTSVLPAQSVEFTNPDNRIVYDFMDTTISRSNQKLRLYIGAESKQSQNAIFFNRPFLFKQDTFASFRIKGSFLQHLVIDSSLFDESGLDIDSTAFDTLFITNTRFKQVMVFKDLQVQDFIFSQNDVQQAMIFIDCKFKNMVFEASSLQDKISFYGCEFGNVSFKNSHFDNTLTLTQCKLIDSVSFNSCAFSKNLNLTSFQGSPKTNFDFLFTLLPDTLDFSDNPLIYQEIDLTKVYIHDQSTGLVCKLLINKTDLSKVKMNYAAFRLIFPKKTTIDEKENLYQGLLQNFSKNAFQASYQALDIEYKRFHAKQGTFGFLWWIPEYWWQYGYKRENIFKIVFWSLLFFSFLNVFLLNYMVRHVYSVNNIPTYAGRKVLSRLWFAIVYTVIIFFSLSLKIDNVQFKNKAGTAYLFVIYTFGVISLAYMANYIIQR